MSDYYERQYRFLFDWHCRNFYNFRRALMPEEWRYLESCFALAPREETWDWSSGPHFSSFTYSHRLKGDRVNSSRLAFGSVAAPEEVAPLAHRVLQARGLSVDEYFLADPNSHFYMLGWDFEESHFKVYFRLDRLDGLPAGPLLDLLEGYPGRRHPQGLVSLTFCDGAAAERKVYVYAVGEALPAGAYAVTCMLTDRRGPVPQYDVNGDWSDRLGATGRELIKRYGLLGYGLDTIAYTAPDDCTLYFPARLGSQR